MSLQLAFLVFVESLFAQSSEHHLFQLLRKYESHVPRRFADDEYAFDARIDQGVFGDGERASRFPGSHRVEQQNLIVRRDGTSVPLHSPLMRGQPLSVHSVKFATFPHAFVELSRAHGRQFWIRSYEIIKIAHLVLFNTFLKAYRTTLVNFKLIKIKR